MLSYGNYKLKMKAAIYSPYLDTLGGGERYVMSVAKVLFDQGFSVDVESSDIEIIKKLENKLGIFLEGIKVVASIKRGDGYGLCFWLSDGSIPLLSARRNIIHFQRPFYEVDGKSLINRMKFLRIARVVVNSFFTKEWIDKEYPVKSILIYPPVAVDKFKPGKKENLVIYVGRFSQLEQSKRQDVLVRAFKRLYDSGLKNWKLVLAGGSEVGRTKFVDNLIKNSRYYPITIRENLSYSELRDLYARAKIFWSATGFGVDENKNPEKVEHFGITLVEAMAAGVTPLVFAAGGGKEIIRNGENGFLWESVGELIRLTKELVGNDSLSRKISVQARKDAQKYSYERFEKEILGII